MEAWMSLNPFSTVSDYAGMLNKIATWTFFVSVGAVVFLRWRLPMIDATLGVFTLKIPVEGLHLPIGTVAPALVLALLSRVIKLHDRLSDLLGIRARFERQEILMPLALASGATLTTSQLAKIDMHRKDLMGNAFYAYASSNPAKSKIDPHYVIMALDQWSWYWVILEALFICGIVASVLFVGRDYRVAALAISVALIGVGVLQALRHTCRRYALDEIREILKVDGAGAAIKTTFIAL